MKHATKLKSNLHHLISAVGIVALFALLLWAGVSTGYTDGLSTPLNVGYLDFSYQVSSGDPVKDPTGEKPESKLWWNDGFWWGSLYNRDADAYHIYRLDWGTQTWEDTGVVLDERRDSKADTLWDRDNTKLYVVSHVKMENPSKVNNADNWGRLYRYSYDANTQSYSLDSGFPVTVNEDKTETLVLAKDSTGRLWVAYISRNPSIALTDYQVYVNATDGNDDNWGTPFSLGSIFPEAHVDVDDIASAVAFRDNEGDKIGIIWSNQRTGNFHFATHLDSIEAYRSGWNVAAITLSTSANDHISARALKSGSSGYVFAAVKTSTLPYNEEPLIGLIALDGDGNFSFHEFSAKVERDTRPLLLIDEDDNKVYIFVTDKPGGSIICYKSAAITSPLSNIRFPSGDCGEPFLVDDAYDSINNATSTKQNVNRTTGIVVMASDSGNGGVYVHNVLGNPPPVVTNHWPAAGATNVPVDAVVTATFSKAMNASTLNSTNFEVRDGRGPVAGTVTYDSETRTATFTPEHPVKARTVFTATLGIGTKDASDQPLYGAPKMWNFTTELPTVQFSNASYSAHEDRTTVAIIITLNTPSSEQVQVEYATRDNTATAGKDYTPTSGTLTFAPGETSKSFNVRILRDGAIEGNETVNLMLKEPVNAKMGTPANAMLTIIDTHAIHLPIIMHKS